MSLRKRRGPIMMHIVRYFKYCVNMDIALYINHTVNILIMQLLFNFNELIGIMGYIFQKENNA